MEQIRLTKEEKQAFRIVSEFGGECPVTYPKHVFVASVRSIERKGLVKALIWLTVKCGVSNSPKRESITLPLIQTCIILLIGI